MHKVADLNKLNNMCLKVLFAIQMLPSTQVQSNSAYDIQQYQYITIEITVHTFQSFVLVMVFESTCLITNIIIGTGNLMVAEMIHNEIKPHFAGLC